MPACLVMGSHRELRPFLVLGSALLVAGCGGSKSDRRIDQAAVRLVQEHGATVTNVRCSTVDGHTHKATCTLRSKSGTVYSCDVFVDRVGPVQTACVWDQVR